MPVLSSKLGIRFWPARRRMLQMWCPACDDLHQISLDPPATWTWDGNAEAPTFAPSILVTYGGADAGQGDAPPARCHSFVRQGVFEYCPDSSHAMAGKSAPMADLPDWVRKECEDDE